MSCQASKNRFERGILKRGTDNVLERCQISIWKEVKHTFENKGRSSICSGEQRRLWYWNSIKVWWLYKGVKSEGYFWIVDFLTRQEILSIWEGWFPLISYFFFSCIKNLLLLIYTSLSDKKDLKQLSLSRFIISWHYTRVDNRTKLGQDEDKYPFHLFCFKNIYTISLCHILSWSSWYSFQVVWPRVGAQRIHFDKWCFPHGQKEVRLNQNFEST